MPSLDSYKKILGVNGNTQGRVRKNQSDKIMEASWSRDIAAQVVYFYDYYHDDEKYLFTGLHPEDSIEKIPVDVKIFANASNSENKDQVGYFLQFKPSFNWKNEFSYYQESFVDKYGADFPVGLYLDRWDDDKKIWRKWYVAEPANWLGNQFPTYYILPCDHLFQWIYNGIKYQMCGVIRSQNSYNAGEYTDHTITRVENQLKCCMPMNDISSTLAYGSRIVISAPMEIPIVWHISKMEGVVPKGTNRLTFYQKPWDEHTDVFEYYDGEITNKYNPNKKIIGMWADYYKSNIEPENPSEIIPTNYSVITYSGIKPEIKSGGSYKKFTVTFFNSDGEEIPFETGVWKCEIDNTDAGDLISTLDSSTSSDVNENQIKIKFNKDDHYIGKIMIVSYDTGEVKSEIQMEIKGL